MNFYANKVIGCPLRCICTVSGFGILVLNHILHFDRVTCQLMVDVYAFLMRIYKAQGQSLKLVELKLDSDVFFHGQFHVGCSRVGSPENLFFLHRRDKTEE